MVNYCVWKSADMSFSNASPAAYVEGNIQRTPVITFNADSLQTVTFILPTGVTLVNDTTGASGSGWVSISGGQQFHLTAPLNQAVTTGQTFTQTLTGTIGYPSATLISPSDPTTQILVTSAGVTQASVNFSVTWTDEAYVSVTLKDSETNNTLQGATYGVYSNANCTNLLATMSATNANGTSSVTIHKVQQNAPDTVYLKEISTRTGYLKDTTAHPINLLIGQTTSTTLTNQRVKASISLTKQDAETGSTPQGDAKLSGAVYGLYARTNINYPDGKKGVVYTAGTEVAKLTTNANGQASIDNLYLGEYYIKEISPSEGYLIDGSQYNVSCTYEGDSKAVVTRSVTSKEQVIKQPVQIINIADDESTIANQDNSTLLAHSGFTIYLNSNPDTPVKTTSNGGTEIFTDNKGHATTIALPYGSYTVKETTTPTNYNPVNDFSFTIEENSTTPQVWRVLINHQFKATLRIVKKDENTGKTVLLANTEFKIYDVDHEEYVEQVTLGTPGAERHATYFTNANGFLFLPNDLDAGTYRIEEVHAPEGYVLSDSVEVTVTNEKNTAYQVEPLSGRYYFEVTFIDKPVTGKLAVYKHGEVLTGYNKENGFIYEDKPLQNAVYEVYAAENIYTPDHQVDANGNRTIYQDKNNVVYTKDTLVATIKTGADGYAYAENLPLGSYYVKEKNAPNGFTLNDTTAEVTFAYKDQDTPVIEIKQDMENERQKVDLSVTKQNVEDETDLVEGAVFEIYNTDDIKDYQGNVIVPKDTDLQEITSDKDGKAAFTLDFPLGKYYVKETTAPDGYITPDKNTKLDFGATYQGQDVATVKLNEIYKNTPTTVEISKQDIGGAELPGAHLQVVDENGNEIDSWISGTEPHIIKKLVVGKTYKLIETKPADGYATAEEVKFTIEDTGEVQPVVMTDDTTKISISKKDMGGKELPGAKMMVVEKVVATEDTDNGNENIGNTDTDNGNGDVDNTDTENGSEDVDNTNNAIMIDDEEYNIIDSWTSGEEPHLIEGVLVVGNTYKLVESRPADGYATADSFDFTIEDTGEIQAQTMVDDTTKISISKQDMGGEEIPGAEMMVVEKVVATEDTDNGNEDVDNTENGNENIGNTDTDNGNGDVDNTENSNENIDNTENGSEDVDNTDNTIMIDDEEYNIIDSWISGTEPHMIEGVLVVGNTYKLVESRPADGYATADSFNFTIEDTGEIQAQTMVDDTTKISISKQDMGGEELPGAEMMVIEKVVATEDTDNGNEDVDNTENGNENMDNTNTGNGNGDVDNTENGNENIDNTDNGNGDVDNTDTENGSEDVDNTDNTIMIDDEEYNIIDSWTSGTEPHMIEGVLVVGNTYKLVESRPADGYATADSFDFTIEDTGEIQAQTMVDDTTKISISKQDMGGEEIPGAKMQVVDEDGNVVDNWTSGTTPHIIEGLLVVGQTYTLVESRPADGYTTADSFDFTIQDTGEIQAQTMVDDTTKVELSKQDVGGKELPGAHLQVVDANGKEVDSWVSGTEPHMIEGKLIVGEKYTMTETKPADGYATAESITFTIKDNGDVQKVTMTDDVTKVMIHKADIAGEEVPGAKLRITDSNGNVVAEWTSTKEAHYIEKLPIGTYTLHEELAPDGYQIANDVKFEVKDTTEIQHVVMIDKAVVAPTKTNDTTNLMMWIMVLVLATGALGTAAGLKKKYR
jgi:hypothetical protein